MQQQDPYPHPHGTRTRDPFGYPIPVFLPTPSCLHSQSNHHIICTAWTRRPRLCVWMGGTRLGRGWEWARIVNCSVTIFLLFHNLLLLVYSQRVHILLVYSQRVHILLGMCRYNYASLLLVVHPFHSRMFVL